MTNGRLRQIVRDVRGAAIIELALVAPVLALLTIGVVDLGNAFSRKLALEQGAHRAIEKIMQTTEMDTVEGTLKTEAVCQVNGTNSDGTCKSTPISASNVTVSYRLECTAPGGSISAQTSTDPDAFDALDCSGGTTREARYIEVALTDRYDPMFPLAFGPAKAGDGKYPISATAGVRTQ
jgi:Flp pilus assembly protein TadG